jgi:hypothetical protein
MNQIFQEKIYKRFLLCYISIGFLFSLNCCDTGLNVKTGQNNAIWTESIYLRGYRPSTLHKLTNSDIQEYAETLKRNNIRYSYLFAGPYGKDGHLPKFAFSDIAINSVKLLKKYYPEIIILPWVGGIQNKTVHLEDSIWVNNALADSKRLIETLLVSGLHLDFEYILKDDSFFDLTIDKEKPGDIEAYGKNINEFHRKLRTLMPEAFISAVVTATSPGTKPWKRKTKLEELKVLVKYVNQLSFLYYDTYIDNQADFQKNCNYLVNDIQDLKRSGNQSNVQYLIAIGTFINIPELQKYRNLGIENIPNSLKTIKRSILNANPNEQIIDGISIFCDWQTDKGEWRQIYKYWTNETR